MSHLLTITAKDRAIAIFPIHVVFQKKKKKAESQTMKKGKRPLLFFFFKKKTQTREITVPITWFILAQV